MTDNQMNDILIKMGYTISWLNYGILTVAQLIEQEEIFDNSDNKNTEHYRYQAFGYYLRSKSELSDNEFDNYLALTFEDSDPVMAGSAAADLFSKVNLTDGQFERLCKNIGHFGKWTKKNNVQIFVIATT